VQATRPSTQGEAMGKHTTESIIKAASHETQNARGQTPPLKTRKKGTKIKRERMEILLTPNTLLYLNFNQYILIF
jgi:hypothetical protein